MSLSLCHQHQQSKNVIDLNLFQAICSKCALFDPLHKHHNFLEADHIEEHSMKQIEEFQKRMNNITLEGQPQKWKDINTITSNCLENKVKQINFTYDQIIKDLEKERNEKIEEITGSIKEIENECQAAAQAVVRDTFTQLCTVNQSLKKLADEKSFLLIEKKIAEEKVFLKIGSIENEMQIIKIDLHQKLKGISMNPFHQIPLKKKKTSVIEELLLNNEEDNEFLSMELSQKSDNLTCGSNCLTELSFCAPDIELPFFRSESKLDKSRLSTDQNNKRVKTVLNKCEIKTMHIRNDIRKVNFSQLSMTDREAFEAIKKSTDTTFVNYIDLSNNRLTSQLILILKREKNISKYLKTIVMKGIRIDQKILTKQGISAQTVKSGKIHLGNITIQL